MGFTYTPASPDDVTRVRFHIGDTTEATALFPDDTEITFAINDAGSWQKAVLYCIENVLARINADPDFSFDELEIDQDSARTHWETLLGLKRKQFGISFTQSSSVSTTTVIPTRASDF
jgi:hypothetical protein